MTTKFTLKTNTQRPPPHFKSRVRRCVYNCPPWPPTAGKALQKRDTDEPDLERAAREYADGAYHANITPAENGFWVEAKDLQAGDVFIGVNGELSVLIDIDRVELDEAVTVYNFSVAGNHNYFVIAAGDEHGQTSVLVHNAQGQDGNNKPHSIHDLTPVGQIMEGAKQATPTTPPAGIPGLLKNLWDVAQGIRKWLSIDFDNDRRVQEAHERINNLRN